MPTSGARPRGRTGCFVFSPHKDWLVRFALGLDSCILKPEFCCLHLPSLRWHDIGPATSLEAKVPSSRKDFAAAFTGSEVYIVGGEAVGGDTDGELLGDVHVLSIDLQKSIDMKG